MLSDNLHINGFFNFCGDPRSNFKGPVGKGSRFVVWIKNKAKSTSCSVVSEDQIFFGETKLVELVLLASFVLDFPIKHNTILLIGSPKIKIGEFKVLSILGQWKGKVP